jgi:hypothetical protein
MIIQIEYVGKIYAERNIRYVMRRAFALMGEIRNTYKNSVGKPEGTRPFERLGANERILVIPVILKQIL